MERPRQYQETAGQMETTRGRQETISTRASVGTAMESVMKDTTTRAEDGIGAVQPGL